MQLGPSRIVLITLVAFVAIGSSARAEGPLGPAGARIRTSNYNLDLGAQPLNAGARVTGLAGAFVAIAEDVDGNQHNPAAPAVRPAYSFDAFDYYLGGGLTGISAFQESDLFNSGRNGEVFEGRSSAIMLGGAVNLQWRDWGMGVTFDSASYSLRPEGVPESDPLRTLNVSLGGLRIQVARALLDGQLVIGGGMRTQLLSVQDQNGNQLFGTAGPQGEVGVLVRPNGQQFRIGVALSSTALTTVEPDSQLQPNNQRDIILGPETGMPIYLPGHVVVPWKVDAGIAWQFGPRPLNPRWIDPNYYDRARRHELERAARERAADLRQRTEAARALGDLAAVDAIEEERERARKADAAALEAFEEETRRELKRVYRALPRRYLLVSAAIDVRGATDNAVGLESFLQGIVQRSGQAATISPRLGLEAEPLADRLRARVGTYYEPSRFPGVDGRFHLTFGFDVRVLSWSVFGLWPEDQRWKIGAVMDRAPRFFNLGATLGGWY